MNSVLHQNMVANMYLCLCKVHSKLGLLLSSLRMQTKLYLVHGYIRLSCTFQKELCEAAILFDTHFLGYLTHFAAHVGCTAVLQQPYVIPL